MTIDKKNILLYLEDSLNEFFEEDDIKTEIEEEMTIAKERMKRDTSEANLHEQVCIIQSILDNIVVNEGASSSLTIVQARINQLRSVFELID